MDLIALIIELFFSRFRESPQFGDNGASRELSNRERSNRERAFQKRSALHSALGRRRRRRRCFAVSIRVQSRVYYELQWQRPVGNVVPSGGGGDRLEDRRATVNRPTSRNARRGEKEGASAQDNDAR